MRIERALRRIHELRAINAFVFVDPSASGKAGLVVAVKDNIDVRGMPTTAGGRHLSTEARQRDAKCVRRLRAAGCAIVGKTNLYEYAMGGTSENPHYGNVLNPRHPDRDAGGSSSGSAAAVAAGMCDAALGTDTLGSVRLPAAFCGVVGYKPPRHAMHVDVSVAREHVQARLAAALAAGGRIVRHWDVPEAWTLADRAGNRVCICAGPDGATGAHPPSG